MSDVENAMSALEASAECLLDTIKSNGPQINDALSGNGPLPNGCPSRNALAALIVQQMREKLAESESRIQVLEHAISAS